tara:strand:+ start:10667 stop:12397 length:1731 start_codon:yes stop_codon:yes gene_type:complete
MALSPQEQKELADLENELNLRSREQSEAQELAEIEAELTAREQERASGVQQKYGELAPQAALESFGQAATFGYLPQIQAGLATATEFFDKFKPGTPAYADEELRRQGFTIDQKGDTYLEKRDENIARIEGLQEANPVSSAAGTVGGAISSGIALSALGGGGAVAQNLSRAEKLIRGAGAGALYGAVQNPGDIKGEYGGLQLEERAGGALKGAILGTATVAAGEVLKAAADQVKKIPGKLQDYAELKALKASGAMLKDFRKAFGNKKANDMGRVLLDKKIVNIGDDITSIAEKASVIKDEVGQEIGNIYESVDDAYAKVDYKKLTPLQRGYLKDTKVDLEKFAINQYEKISNKLKGLAGRNTVLDNVGKVLDDIKANGSDVSLGRIREIRSSIDDMINYGKANNQLGSVEKELLGIRSELRALAEKKVGAMDKITKTAKLPGLQKANKEYSLLSDATKMAKDKVAREESNAVFGLRERISGGAGIAGALASGADPVTAAIVGGVAGAATKVARQYGTAMTARTVDTVSKILAEDPVFLGKFSDTLIKAAQKSPERYVRAIMELEKRPTFKRKIKERQ